jgi:hypothetical protein
MSEYDFQQRGRPTGDFRISDIIEFLDLVREAFRCSKLYNFSDKPIDISEEGLEKIFRREEKKILPGVGVNVSFFTLPPGKKEDNTVVIEIHSGSDPDGVLIDTFNLLIGDKKKLPNLDYLEKSIEIFKPLEAFLADRENEWKLRARDRQRAIGGFTKPAIIRGLHYLDRDLAKSIGGINYCLKAPAWHVDKFCEGVLIDLVPGVFDSTNPEHLEVQEKVMAYFDIL